MKRKVLLLGGGVVALTLLYWLGRSGGTSAPASDVRRTRTDHFASAVTTAPSATATSSRLAPATGRSWIGGACESDADCGLRGGRCLFGVDYPGGYCTAPCKETCADRRGEPITFCASEETSFGGGGAACVSRCDYKRYAGPSSGCRAGYECVLAQRASDDTTVESVCLPTISGFNRGSARLPWRRRPGGREALVKLETAPYPHESRAGGHVAEGKYYPRRGHYDDPSAFIIVPKRFKDTGNVDLVFHFHGYNGDIRRVIDTKKLRKQFLASKRNAVMVLVQGPKSVPDSYPGKLADHGGFRNLVTEVVGLLHADGLIAKRRLGLVALTSHSGGYRAVAAGLNEHLLGRRITEVYLFDSFYGEYSTFFEYATQTRGRFVSLVTHELAGANARFKARLRARGASYATDLRDEERITLLRTRRSHADAPRCGNLQRMLESATLETSLPPG